jgi:hypothetical protein
MKMGNALDPAEVARQTLGALGTRSTVLPGFRTKFLTYSLALLPRWARVRVMGNVMSGMIQPRGAIRKRRLPERSSNRCESDWDHSPDRGHGNRLGPHKSHRLFVFEAPDTIPIPESRRK